jgi:hypothetical protein
MAEQFPEVAGFLAALDHGDRERFLGDCESRDSAYQLWLYACAMGYEGGFDQLDSWLRKRYPRLDPCKILMAEVVRLESDLASLRDPVLAPEDGGGPAFGRGSRHSSIASLSKELRGCLGEIDRVSKGIDRRGLMLAGVDRLMRELEAAFDGNEQVEKALAEAFELVWRQIQEER